MFENRYLTRWHEAGLLDAATIDRIRLHEAKEQRPLWLWAVSGLGCFAIAVGIVSVVAANWDHIPANLKLGIDFLLLAGLAAGLVVADTKAWLRVRDLLALLLFGLVLASIALISQIYQLDGKTSEALATWVVICTPFLLLGTDSRLLAAAWALAVVATVMTGWVDNLQSIREWIGHDPVTLQVLLPAFVFLTVSLCLDFRPRRRAQADMLRQLGVAALLVAATLPQLKASDFPARFSWSEPLIGLGLAAGLLVLLLARRRTDPRLTPIAILVAAAAACCLAAFAAIHVALGDGRFASILVAVPFIAFWAIAGWLALRGGRRMLFIAAFTVISVRVLIFYWEAFGGLLNTGLGLITGGFICLLLAAIGRWLFSRGARQVAT